MLNAEWQDIGTVCVNCSSARTEALVAEDGMVVEIRCGDCGHEEERL